MDEVWLPAPRFPKYEVSNLGRCRRSPNHPSQWMKEALSSSADKRGYRRVYLVRGGRFLSTLLHRLVCEAFHGPPPTEHHEVAHGDGDPGNCREGNLRWATRRENHADKRRHGTHVEGELMYRASLTNAQVSEIKALLRSGARNVDVRRAYGVTKSTIEKIKDGRNWKHVA